MQNSSAERCTEMNNCNTIVVQSVKFNSLIFFLIYFGLVVNFDINIE